MSSCGYSVLSVQFEKFSRSWLEVEFMWLQVCDSQTTVFDYVKPECTTAYHKMVVPFAPIPSAGCAKVITGAVKLCACFPGGCAVPSCNLLSPSPRFSALFPNLSSHSCNVTTVYHDLLWTAFLIAVYLATTVQRLPLGSTLENKSVYFTSSTRWLPPCSGSKLATVT